MTDTRTQVRTHVEANPGTHFNDIRRNLDIATGQTQYHLRRLLRDDSLQRKEVSGRTHYFPHGYSECEQRAIALLRRETTRELVVVLLDEADAHPDELADEVGIVRSTVEWHLSNLVEAGLATKTYEGRSVSVSLSQPDLLRELLVEIDPHLPDRLVDRFTRLVDSLLDQ